MGTFTPQEDTFLPEASGQGGYAMSSPGGLSVVHCDVLGTMSVSRPFSSGSSKILFYFYFYFFGGSIIDGLGRRTSSQPAPHQGFTP